MLHALQQVFRFRESLSITHPFNAETQHAGQWSKIRPQKRDSEVRLLLKVSLNGTNIHSIYLDGSFSENCPLISGNEVLFSPKEEVIHNVTTSLLVSSQCFLEAAGSGQAHVCQLALESTRK